MAAFRAALGDEIVENFSKAKYLAEVESNNDPEDEPYRSKYKARELYKETRIKLKEKTTDTNISETDKQTITYLTLVLDQLLGLNYIECEELSEGEDYLTSCLKALEEKELDNAISLHITTLNHLGILWSERRCYEKALQYLQKSEGLYHNYKKEIGDAPEALLEVLEPFEGNESEQAHLRCLQFESVHTHTLYYLAQVFAKLEQNGLSAQYCHMTLERQLRAGDYDPVDWALNAATLSQYYITAERFSEARHCLASGSFIFSTAKKAPEALNEQELELQSQRDSDIERCWIKYGLNLLEASRDAMFNEIQNEDVVDKKKEPLRDDHNADKKADASFFTDAATNDNQEHMESEEKIFKAFELELTCYEELITDKLVRTFDEARKIFLFVVDRITNARKFYTLDSHASDAVEIIQDHSRAYKLLAFFELDMSRQSRMHKRRADMLSDLLKELNPRHYLLVCRQVIFELAEIFSEMADVKITLIEMERLRATPHYTCKINKLLQQSIEKYQAYIDTLKGGKPDLPEEFPEGDVRPALVAYFCMGRLYSKVLEPDPSRRLSLMAKSLECYKSLVDYCDKHLSARELVSSEYDVCKEMVSLLPLKMAKFQAEQNM
ncbi:kif1-binding protein homolog [Plakobranchus ocellatus]|uniref:KIF-binding protein n=1 Tax=Plakobranchus ocellatus TaxID=259542 RepID=A0AAV4CG62_9GAST|nr:kif1-binding protein homolog [Plakobranchus ocellatus]